METAQTAKPKLSFTGVGWIGRNRMQAAAESGLAEIIYITDPSEQCLEEANKIVPHSKKTNSFNDAINDPFIEGVVIATPSAMHMQQSVQAFENGKAVFCQKPLGRTANEVQQVINAARTANKRLGVDFSYRYTTAFKKLYDVVQSGELGNIFSVELKFHNAYGPDKPWFYDINQSGGGCVLDLGIHLIDLMLYALDFPSVKCVNSQLFSKGKSIKGKNEVEDFADVQITLENDISVSLSCSWNLHAGCDAVIETAFYGTNGGVSMKNVNGSFYDFKTVLSKGTNATTLFEEKDNWGGRALIDWIEKLSDDDSFSEDANQFLQSAKIIDKIYGRI